MANNRKRTFTRAPRRGTFWEGVSLDATVTTGASVVIAAVSEATLEGIPNPTVVRVRGRLTIIPSAPSGLSRAHLTMGLIVPTAVAFAVPAVPVPGTDVGSDWFWWDTVSMITDGSAVTPLNNAGLSCSQIVTVDNKAMRKIQPNRLIAVVFENTARFGTMSIRVTGELRLLFKK